MAEFSVFRSAFTYDENPITRCRSQSSREYARCALSRTISDPTMWKYPQSIHYGFDEDRLDRSLRFPEDQKRYDRYPFSVQSAERQ